MRAIPITDIQILSNRQRRTFDEKALRDLGESILQHGLLQPIVLRPPREGESGPFVLVAGERRLRAIRDLSDLSQQFSCDGEQVPLGSVPYTLLGELSPLLAEEAELEENLRRVNLSWQEHAAAVARLAALRKAQSPDGAPPPTLGDLSAEVRDSRSGSAMEATRREVILAKHLDNPLVAKAKTADDAWKALKQAEQVAQRTELAKEVGKTYAVSEALQAFHTDCLAWMKECPDAQFDVICTDPPYGIDADAFGDSGGHVPVDGHGYADSYDAWLGLLPPFATSSFRICKPEAHLYAFCDITRFDEMKKIFTAAGWRVFRTPLIWHKPNGNRLPWVEEGPQRKYEIILFAQKGRKKVTRIYPDLISYPADENLGHAAQKPVALYVDLLRRSVLPGDKVLDPFAGSGPIFPAAEQLHLSAVGLEQDAKSFGICIERIRALGAQADLFGDLK